MIHKVQHCQHVLVFDAFQVEERVGVWISLEDRSEEWAACREDNFVGLHLLPLTGQCHIKQVFVLPQLSEGRAHVALELVPLQAEILRAPSSRHLGFEF